MRDVGSRKVAQANFRGEFERHCRTPTSQKASYSYSTRRKRIGKDNCVKMSWVKRRHFKILSLSFSWYGYSKEMVQATPSEGFCNRVPLQ